MFKHFQAQPQVYPTLPAGYATVLNSQRDEITVVMDLLRYDEQR